ncbi:uncharacterized protein N7473_007122 [Penicillium subrubescens]|uniref:uncharacterized protein n=1 Tax=Penicillium subrubescens TaxID=1316194 RepID=UPI00254552DE|nr:uncharacterized protein N7473_007122 [Penicillium subrubescens]KAJ5890894.1 hypothetical protein N7473_007122 [Penicillium subrubescens]
MNTECLAEGDYDVFCPRGDIKLTEETCVRRIFSLSRSGRGNDSFRDSVRSRDGKCVLTGVVNTDDDWAGIEAADIFPVDREGLLPQRNFNHSINSVQNGLLVSATMHQLFDSYLVSVNPDITDFGGNKWDVDGRVLDIVCRDPNNPIRVADELLRWHFCQSVLANMKGAGEPIFEHDFPPGTEVVGEILIGPLPAERMELELFSRLQGASQEDNENETI